jgi:hypothetical protein
VKLYAFLTSALDMSGELHSDRFNHGTYWLRGWLGLSVWTSGGNKNPCRGSNSGRPPLKSVILLSYCRSGMLRGLGNWWVICFTRIAALKVILNPCDTAIVGLCEVIDISFVD